MHVVLKGRSDRIVSFLFVPFRCEFLFVQPVLNYPEALHLPL
jgi:hypothetical protein